MTIHGDIDLLDAHWREDVRYDGYGWGLKGTVEHDLRPPSPQEHEDCSGAVIDNTTEAGAGAVFDGHGRPCADDIKHMTVPRVGPMQPGDVVGLDDGTGRWHHIGQAVKGGLIGEARSAHLPEGEQLQLHDLAYWKGRAGFQGPRYFPNVVWESHTPATVAGIRYRLWFISNDANARAATLWANANHLGATLQSRKFTAHGIARTAWLAEVPPPQVYDLGDWLRRHNIEPTSAKVMADTRDMATFLTRIVDKASA